MKVIQLVIVVLAVGIEVALGVEAVGGDGNGVSSGGQSRASTSTLTSVFCDNPLFLIPVLLSRKLQTLK